MPDNSTDDTIIKLIRYMDGELNTAEKEATEKLLREDTTLYERYQMLLAAKQAVRSQGLKQRVQTLHKEYMREAESKKTVPVKVKPASFFKTFMRVAAVFIIAVAGYGVFQYASTTNQSVYNDNFTGYQLPVNRSDERAEGIDVLYKAGNYAAVITAFNSKQQKNQKDYFLAAQSYLQLNNAAAAISAFQEVEKINNTSAEKYFEQETDYYLLLAYIKGGKIDAAEKQLNIITSNKQHLFYSKAEEISRTTLMLLKWKDE